MSEAMGAVFARGFFYAVKVRYTLHTFVNCGNLDLPEAKRSMTRIIGGFCQGTDG
jgi:hypothetical protein